MLTLAAKKEENKAGDPEAVFGTLVNKNQSVNPFLTQMYYKISFNAWLNLARAHERAKMFPDRCHIDNNDAGEKK